MKRNYLILLLVSGVLTSCVKDARIRVQNNVSNASLESINWAGQGVSYSLLPGETSDEQTISDDRGDWPKSSKLSFVMTANGKSVYLETVEIYHLDADQELLIVIDNETPVSNPSVD